MRILKWALAVLVLVLVVGAVISYLWLKSTVADYDGERLVDGLREPVEIIRDSFGMPHIYAENDHDVYFALGYAMAQDRLFQMDMVRRTVRGTLAEVLGPQLLDSDLLFRTITAPVSPEEILGAQSSEVQDALGAFAAGIDSYLDNPDARLPLEFTLIGYTPERWQTADCTAALYYMAWMLNFAFRAEMLYAAIIDRLGPEAAADLFIDYPSGYPVTLPDTTDFSDFGSLLALFQKVADKTGAANYGGSNAWVVGGSKAHTGMPLLANDMHLPFGLPCIWYEAHLVTPDMNVSGVTAPGVPLIIVGANEHVAWGFTNAMADDTDFYREKLDPADSSRYIFRDSSTAMELFHHRIPIRDSDTIEHIVRLTRHGPVISDLIDPESDPGEVIAMRWVLYDLHQEATTLYQVNRAETIDGLEAALDYWKCPGINWLYADDRGEISFWCATGIPIRDGFDGSVPIPGWDGDHEWQGYVPTKREPHLRNPVQAWLASANNLQLKDYPYPISHYYSMPDRMERITEELTSRDKFSLADLERLQLDEHLVIAEELLPIFLEVLENEPLSTLTETAMTYLKGWDYNAHAESVPATIFHTHLGFLIEETFKPHLGDELYVKYKSNPWRTCNAIRRLIQEVDTVFFDVPRTAERESRDDMIVRTFLDAIEYLREKLGEDITQWRWGDLHTLTVIHPISRGVSQLGSIVNRGPFPFGGSIATVNPGAYSLPHGWQVYAGASMRYIFDLQDMHNAARIIPGGISGNPLSPHYADQLPLWLEGNYRPFLLFRDEVEADAEYRMTLTPNVN